MKETKITFSITVCLCLLFVTLKLASNIGAHTDDKGYRLCMNALVNDNGQYTRLPSEFVDACGTKYIGIEIKSH